MNVLSAPRHPLVERALGDARTWCFGHVIDDRPALAHAVQVAATVVRYVPGVRPDVVCAALLHDSPELAPPDIDLDAVLAERYGPETTRLVRALEREHLALDRGDPAVTADDLPLLLVSVADKIVALSSLLHRAHRSGDPAAFFTCRPVLLGLLPFFRAVEDAACGRIPPDMHGRLTAVTTALERGTAQQPGHRRDVSALDQRSLTRPQPEE